MKNREAEARRRLFVREYLVDLNGTRAAIAVGYAPCSAVKKASQLLARPDVKAALARERRRLERKTEVTAERVLNEIAVVAFSDMEDHLDQGRGGVKLKRFGDMPGGASRALESVSESSGPGGKRVSVKLHDKMKALDKLCKHLGICREQLDLSGKVDTELTIKVVKV